MPLSRTARNAPTFMPNGADPQPDDAAGRPARPQDNTLIVGRNIRLKGEISACQRLIVEGRVEASMHSGTIEIAEGGVMCGDVEVDSADIFGRFEGNLTARKRLTVHKTGQVKGRIRFGEVAIDAGGTIAGDVEVIGPETADAKDGGGEDDALLNEIDALDKAIDGDSDARATH